jgi:hypothetical protein
VAEAAITAEVIQLGLVVLRPLCEGSRYDLIVDLEPRLLRVQCKLAKLTRGVRLRTNRYTPRGYVATTYSPSEVDAIAAYSTELRRCFLLPIAEVRGRHYVHLRIEPSRNNQARGVNWADAYQLDTMIEMLQGPPGSGRAEQAS